MRALKVSLACLLCSVLAPANAEPLNIKGLVPGQTTKAQLRAFEVAGVRLPPCPLAQQSTLEEICFAKFEGNSLGGEPVRDITVSFMDGVLRVVMIKVSVDHAATLAELYKAKFGNPARNDPYTAQNGFGATFSGRKYFWVDGPNALIIETLSSRVGEGSVTLINSEMASKLDALRNPNKENAADDL